MQNDRIFLNRWWWWFSRSVVSDSLWPHGLWPARLLCPWSSLSKNTGVGCHSLLQGIFPTQGLNLGLLHYRQILYHWATKKAPFKQDIVLYCIHRSKMYLTTTILLTIWLLPSSCLLQNSSIRNILHTYLDKSLQLCSRAIFLAETHFCYTDRNRDRVLLLKSGWGTSVWTDDSVMRLKPYRR